MTYAAITRLTVDFERIPFDVAYLENLTKREWEEVVMIIPFESLMLALAKVEESSRDRVLRNFPIRFLDMVLIELPFSIQFIKYIALPVEVEQGLRSMMLVLLTLRELGVIQLRKDPPCNDEQTLP